MKRQQRAFRPTVGDQVRLEDRTAPATSLFSFGFASLAAFAPPVKQAQITVAVISNRYSSLISQTQREARLQRTAVNNGTVADWSEAAANLQASVLGRVPGLNNSVQNTVALRHPFRFPNINPTIDNINDAFFDAVDSFDPTEITTQNEFNALVNQINSLTRQASSRSQQAVFSGGVRPRGFSDIF